MNHLSEKEREKTPNSFQLFMLENITLRSGIPEDLEFLFVLKKATLKEYVAQIWGWDDAFQYTRHQQTVNPELYKIIQISGKDIGCIEVDQRSDTLVLSVIEILPIFQNKGIGSKLIKEIIERGKNENKNIMLQVLKVNHKAFNLYKNLGFVTKDETETHYQMVYQI